MPSPLPRRALADWTPEAGDVTEWLARWEAAGCRVEAGTGGDVLGRVTYVTSRGARAPRPGRPCCHAMMVVSRHHGVRHTRPSGSGISRRAT